jgi:hypothetical protein
MTRIVLVLVAVGALIAVSAAVALAVLPTYPSNGYIGVYGDPAATNCCITVPPATPTTLYVVAVTGGASAAGFTSAEFRIEVSPPAPSAFLVWSATTAANVVLGSPIDNSSAVNDNSGLDIAFRTCQKQAGVAGDQILLGTITVLNLTGEHQLLVKKHNHPSNPNIKAALFTLCDAPNYTAVPLTLLDGDPELYGQEPYVFRTALNSASCAGSTCGFVGVAPGSWSQVKELYR